MATRLSFARLSLLMLSGFLGSPLPAQVTPELSRTYEQDTLLDIEIFSSQWDALRNQDPQGGYCAFYFLGDRYDWFKFEDIRVNGVSYPETGLKKRSWCGSASKDKPSLNMKFDKYNKAIGAAAKKNLGTDSLTLNNSHQDWSYVRQCLSYQIIREAGLPAPLCNFARIRVNGQEQGVYINLQPMKKDFLRTHFNEGLGNLYEISGEPFDWWALDSLKANFDSYKEKEDESLDDVKALISALDAQDLARIEALVDVPQFLQYWSLEVLLSHYDGLTLGTNNAYVYFPAQGKMKTLPWGLDQTLNRQGDWEARQIYSENRLARALFQVPAYRAQLQSNLEDLLTRLWNIPALNARIDATVAAISDFVPAREKDRFLADVNGLKAAISSRPEQIRGITLGQSGITLRSAAFPASCLSSHVMNNQRQTQAAPCAPGLAQTWDFAALKTGFIRIRNPESNHCVNLQNNQPSMIVGAWSCSNHPDQGWRVRDLGEGRMQFESERAPGQCLSLNEADANGTIRIEPCRADDDRQVWSVN